MPGLTPSNPRRGTAAKLNDRAVGLGLKSHCCAMRKWCPILVEIIETKQAGLMS
jgi:hypothetical protein